MGFLGILEDKKLPHVPATVILSEEQHITNEATVGLKRGTGKDADIILIPQPSVFPILLPVTGGHRYRLHALVT
mgnify:CR=1 FL=1|jgi:hypothetical protein|tara:strand:+ start:389 stop:610 length:222 start_codon:yes stop_codon:yes gene_type:complete